MSKMSVVAMFAVVMAVVGCGPVEEHKLTRSGEPATEAELISGEQRSFVADGQNISVEGQRAVSAAAELDASAAESCSGWCTSNYCECTGSYECCSAGCRACWDVINPQ